MTADGEALASIAFDGEIIHWRGPAPWLFVPVPADLVGEVRYAARLASYGWGVVPVEAAIGTTRFTTSLFPQGDTYLLPVKVAVQKAAGVGLGDRVSVRMRIVAR
ncbi:DUF1905 domain-containing protein [Sphingosinicella sp. LHD-64]|uniref:DUF1905 domain-containing protein n=1 Tax=Sphingosinicella sp. LHD-64 TaxID=3072139 RepID=UPI0028108936|nr:DUF1905 domain-containing protein [Sphingosinicella sp. LHD-64]MDQ8756112.1 DUF1905 domain-containing protein [Sphingosinicella sp. LHD-64]